MPEVGFEQFTTHSISGFQNVFHAQKLTDAQKLTKHSSKRPKIVNKFL